MKSKKILSNCYCTQHPNQKLNLVCLSQHCPQRGLICSLCKFDPSAQDNIHQSHMQKIVPFKHLINSLENSLQQQQFHPHFQEQAYLSKLTTFRDEALCILGETVNSIAEVMQKLEQKILDDYDSAKSALLHRTDVVGQLKRVIQKAMIHDMRKQQKYELLGDVRGMVGSVRENLSSEYGAKYELNISWQNIIAGFMEQKESLRLKCLVLEQKISSLDASLPDEGIDPSETKMSKRQKKQRQRMKIFDKQAAMFDELSGLSNPSIISQSSHMSKEENKFMKAEKKHKKKQKYGKIGQQFISKIGNPLKQIVYDYIPGKIKEEQKLFIEQSLMKKQKDQKGYKLMSSLLLDEQIKQEKGQMPIFCHLTSSPTIKLSKLNKQAKQTASNSLAFITQNIFARPHISFKIKLSSNILLGIALLSTIIDHKHHFNNKALNHGVYGLDQKGLCFFNNNPDQNNHKKNFYFENRDIVNLRFEKGILWFEKSHGKKNPKKMVSECLKVNLSEQELKGLHFCVWLGDKQDGVQIL